MDQIFCLFLLLLLCADNAGIVRCAPLDKLSSADIRRTFDVNVFAQFWLNKQLLPSMIARRSGHIAAIASIAGLTGTANLVDYWSVSVSINISTQLFVASSI